MLTFCLLLATRPFVPSENLPDLNNPSAWHTSGDFTAPVKLHKESEVPTELPLVGNASPFLITFQKNFGEKGSLTSVEFKIPSGCGLDFKVAGGKFPKLTAVRLLVDGVASETIAGGGDCDFRRVSWDLEPYAGRKAQLELFDAAGGATGFIAASDFSFKAMAHVEPQYEEPLVSLPADTPAVADLDLDGPLHIVKTRARTVDIQIENTMVAPKIWMESWGVGFGMIPSDENQRLISLKLSTPGHPSSSEVVTDRIGQNFWVVRSPADESTRQSLTVREDISVVLFARRVVPGLAKVQPRLSSFERNFYTRQDVIKDIDSIRSWADQNGLTAQRKVRDIKFGRLVLEAIAKTIRYKWNGSDVRGAAACIARGNGACGDINEVLLGALRIAGIPARLLPGRNIVGARRQWMPADDGTMHVAAEFWCEGIGWVPIEASAFQGSDLATGGPLVPFLGESKGDHLHMHYDFAYLDETQRAFQTMDWPFGSWKGSWDGWHAGNGNLSFQESP